MIEVSKSSECSTRTIASTGTTITGMVGMAAICTIVVAGRAETAMTGTDMIATDMIATATNGGTTAETVTTEMTGEMTAADGSTIASLSRSRK
jgi:hypothetical protein